MHITLRRCLLSIHTSFWQIWDRADPFDLHTKVMLKWVFDGLPFQCDTTGWAELVEKEKMMFEMREGRVRNI